MKKFLLGSLAFATMALTSCVQENEDLLNNTFEVFSGEIITSNSRTSLGSDNSVLWSDGDAINLFKKTGYYQKYKVKEGGSATAAFVYDNVNTKGSTLEQHYAVYPYAETNSINGQTISMDLSSLANQTYTASSFEGEKAVMVAKSETTNLPFMNALSVIRVNLNIGGAVIDATVSSIKITSTDENINLTGNATVDMSQDKQPAVIVNDNNAGKVITLSADNVKLSQTATPFYIMVPAGSYAANTLAVEVTAVLNGEYQKCEFTLPALTLERSIITTLSKTFLDDNEWTGTTEGAVEGPWDGETVTMPELVTDDVTGEEYYSVNSASDLVGFATLVNGTASARAVSNGTYNFKLTKDIDLGGHDWTAIGTEESPFKGTFDGGDKTIKNLNIVVTEGKEGKAYLGLFGYAKDATIKNVTVENAYINVACLDIDHSQGHIGAVTGSLEGTSTIENVTVKGDIQIYATQDANGASRVAVVAGGNAYGNVTMKNVHVIANAGSYLKANNNTGALAGQLQGKLVFENCSSNIDVTVNKFFAGGLVGIAAGDSKFINCHTTGDVAVVAGREGRAHDQYRVGGIAGGWADGKSKVCELINCSYTGTLTGKNSDGSVTEVFDYMGYVGRGYALNGCQGSTVIIDGIKYVQKYNTAAEAGIYEVSGANGETVVMISTADELNKLNVKNAIVMLNADIDFQGAAMTKPIELWGNSTFNGNGHKIMNVKTAVQGGYATSLFRGDANPGNKVVKNLVVENLTTPEGYSFAAAIWSDLQGANIVIDNVTINNSTIAAAGTVGGFVGFVSASTTNVTIKNSSINNTNLVGGEADHKRGAVVGRAYGCKVSCENVVVDNVKINDVAATESTLVGDKGYTGTVTVK